MNQSEPERSEVARRLNVPLTAKESELLKKLANAENRSEGKTAQKILRDYLLQAEAEGKI